MPGNPLPEADYSRKRRPSQQLDPFNPQQPTIDVHATVRPQVVLSNILQVVQADLVPSAFALRSNSPNCQCLLREGPRLRRGQGIEPERILEPRGRPRESDVPQLGPQARGNGEERKDEDAENNNEEADARGEQRRSREGAREAHQDGLGSRTGKRIGEQAQRLADHDKRR